MRGRTGTARAAARGLARAMCPAARRFVPGRTRTRPRDVPRRTETACHRSCAAAKTQLRSCDWPGCSRAAGHIFTTPARRATGSRAAGHTRRRRGNHARGKVRRPARRGKICGAKVGGLRERTGWVKGGAGRKKSGGEGWEGGLRTKRRRTGVPSPSRCYRPSRDVSSRQESRELAPRCAHRARSRSGRKRRGNGTLRRPQ